MFLLGLILGSAIGIVITTLCVANERNDDDGNY